MQDFKPHKYQKHCIDRLIESPALGLFLDMGLGKTVITLTAINELKFYRFDVCKVLIIAPKKVAEATWQTEARKWERLNHIRFSTVLGTEKQRIKAIHTNADIYVINRENIPWLVDYYRNKWPFDMVVIDESTSFKNHRAKRFRALRSIRPHIKRIVELTGTPAPNSLIDLWAQVFLLDGGQRLGQTITGYRERYFLPDKRSQAQIFSYKPKSASNECIRGLIGDICISMKSDDYLTLPDIIYHDIPVNLDTKARKAYDKMERDMLLEIDETAINAGSAAVLTNKLLQLCNGAVYDSDRNVAVVHDCKIQAFCETVERLGENHALVFYSTQHDRQRLLEALEKTQLRVRVYASSQDEKDWNNQEIDILLAHPASCAYGLNLQNGGHNLIWFGLCWSLEEYQQANKRLHRQGQTKPVIVHRLVVQDSVDCDVVGALEDKDNTQNQLLEALKARINKAKEK